MPSLPSDPLGEAVVADQGDVLEAIQAFRRRAQGRAT